MNHVALASGRLGAQAAVSMIRAGALDRRITIQGKITTQDDFGGEVVTWGDVATVWAEELELRGIERYALRQFVGHALRTFRIRWSATVAVVTTEHQIIYNGRTFDITDVREIGRREGIELDCYAPSEEPVVA